MKLSASDTEVAHLQLAIEKLKQEVLDLKHADLVLRKDNLKLREESLESSQEISALSNEVKALKATIEWEVPLVKIGTAVRLRFLEQIFSHIDGRQAIEELVAAGDRAVQQGDFTADLAVFRLGHNPPVWSTAASANGSNSNQTSKSINDAMIHLSANGRLVESAHLNKPRLLEHINLSTTFLYHYYTHGRNESYPEFKEIEKINNLLDQQHSVLDSAAFETDLAIGENLLKLKELVHRFICPISGSRKRARND